MNKSFMRLAFSKALLAVALLIAGGHLAQADQIISIPLNDAEKLTIKGAAKDVILANPAVADVTMLRPDLLIIIGKQAGRTTLLILDDKQKVVFNGMVVVSDGSGGLVTVHGPGGQNSYACAQNCTLIQGGNGTISTGSSGGSNLGTGNDSVPPAPTDPAPITKVDTKIKLKMSPNGDINGTRTDVPTYGTAPQ
jgi:hypothetical protein